MSQQRVFLSANSSGDDEEQWEGLSLDDLKQFSREALKWFLPALLLAFAAWFGLSPDAPAPEDGTQ